MARLTKAETDRGRLDVDVTALHTALEESKRAHQASVDEVQELRRQLSRAIQNCSEKEHLLATLQEKSDVELRTRDSDVDALAGTLEELKQLVKVRSAALDASRQEQHSLQDQVRMRENTILELQREIAALQTEVRLARASPHREQPRMSPPRPYPASRPSSSPSADPNGDAERRLKALQQEHDALIRTVEKVKQAFAGREAKLEQELESQRVQLALVIAEKEQLRRQTT